MTAEPAVDTGIFQRVVCGVDHSEASTIAARAAARVTDPDGSLVLVSVDDPSIAVHAGWAMSRVAEELAEEARIALEEGEAEAIRAHRVKTRLLEGDPLHCLLAEIERHAATLIVVGSHGRTRASGIALGSVGTHLLHEAPCAVLVARGPIDLERWPQSIVVGVDGSPESAAALAAAEQLADRTAASLRTVVATGDGHANVEAARRIAPGIEEHHGRGVGTLDELSEDADLVVVGSRGLRGLHALGSVSERVAHDAKCSVLVVREPPD